MKATEYFLTREDAARTNTIIVVSCGEVAPHETQLFYAMIYAIIRQIKRS